MLVDIRECDTCVHNGAYNAKTKRYIYDSKKIKELRLRRDEVYERGTCRKKYDTNGFGCTKYTCAQCLYFVETIVTLRCFDYID